MLFANPGISFIALRRDRGISFQVDEYLSRYSFGKRPAAQCRGISYPGATNCLGIESFITCSGAYPGLRPLQIYLASRLSRCKRLKRKEKFGPILNIWFLLGWRSRHQAKSMTINLPLLSVLGFRGFIFFYDLNK